MAPTFHDWDLGHYLRDILRREGFSVSVFAYQAYDRAGDALVQDLLRLVDREQPDVLLGLKLDRVPAEALRRVHGLGVLTVLWYVD